MIFLIDILKLERINPDFLVCKIILLHFFLPMLWIKMKKMTHACVNKKKKRKKGQRKGTHCSFNPRVCKEEQECYFICCFTYVTRNLRFLATVKIQISKLRTQNNYNSNPKQLLAYRNMHEKLEKLLPRIPIQEIYTANPFPVMKTGFSL